MLKNKPLKKVFKNPVNKTFQTKKQVFEALKRFGIDRSVLKIVENEESPYETQFGIIRATEEIELKNGNLSSFLINRKSVGEGWQYCFSDTARVHFDVIIRELMKRSRINAIRTLKKPDLLLGET